MQNLTQTVNTRALDVTLDALFGPNASQLAGKVYTTVEQAMREGYQLGKLEAEERVEERIDAAFDNGFVQGKDHAEQDQSEQAWDDGYVAGVDDARRRPSVADCNVQYIINYAAANAFNGEYDASNVSDSGDEQPTVVFDIETVPYVATPRPDTRLQEPLY